MASSSTRDACHKRHVQMACYLASHLTVHFPLPPSCLPASPSFSPLLSPVPGFKPPPHGGHVDGGYDQELFSEFATQRALGARNLPLQLQKAEKILGKIRKEGLAPVCEGIRLPSRDDYAQSRRTARQRRRSRRLRHRTGARLEANPCSGRQVPQSDPAARPRRACGAWWFGG